MPTLDKLKWNEIQRLPGLGDLALLYRVIRLIQAGLTIERAAEELGIQKTYLPVKIKNLERMIHPHISFFSLGAGRAASVTAAGEVFCEELHKIFQAYSAAIARVGQPTLTIGAINAVVTYVLPRLLKPFLETHREIQVSIQEGEWWDVMRWVRERQVDIGFADFSQSEECKPQPLVEVPRVVAYPPGHRFEHMKSKEIMRTLPEETVLVLSEEAAPNFSLSNLPLPESGKGRHIVLKNTAEIVAGIKAGWGVGIIPNINLLSEAESVPSKDLSDIFGVGALHLYLPNGNPSNLTSIASAFFSHVQNSIEEAFPMLRRTRKKTARVSAPS